jgi:ABC-type nitrate/sulfonate/bicarbonate transport system permease component
LSTPAKPSDLLLTEPKSVNPAAGLWRRVVAWKYAALSFGLLLLAWQISSAYIPEYIFPGIPKVAEKSFVLLQDPATYRTVLMTMQRILGSFLVSSLVGVALGVAIAMSPRAKELLMPALKLVMGVPALTWVLLSIIWFKSAEMRVWFMMFVLVFPIVATNTYDGVRAIPYELYHMVHALRPTRARMLRMLVIPAATPSIFTGLRVALSFGGRIAVFAEALSASTGIGAAMYSMNQVFDSAGIIAWTFILVIVLTLLDGVLGLIEARWFRWRREFQG